MTKIQFALSLFKMTYQIFIKDHWWHVLSVYIWWWTQEFLFHVYHPPIGIPLIRWHYIVCVPWRQWQAITEIDSRVRTSIWGLDLRLQISRDEAIPATLSCPGPTVTVIERRCIYKVPCSATMLIPVNLRRSWERKCHNPRTRQGSSPAIACR